MLGRLALVLALVVVTPLPALAQPAALSRALDLPRFPRRPLLSASAAASARVVWSHDRTLGEGATICVIDTGIDARHHDFRDAEGRTRIAWLVDLDASAPHGDHPALEARSGAAIWSRASIDAALAAGTWLPGDRHGHGTAIASIAAGDDAGLGETTPGPYAGVAPGAELIVVRTLRDGALGFEDDDVVLGTELCFALTRDPARTVALLALGGHDGAHDGTEPLSIALSEIAARGHALVVAAGNDGDRPIHAAGRVVAGLPSRVGVYVPTPRGDADEHWIALVVRGDVRVMWVAPDGTRLEARRGEQVRAEHRGGRLLLDARTPGVVRVVAAGDADAPLRGGEYELVLEGSGTFDAWLVDAEVGATFLPPALRGPHVVPGETVTIPATSPAVIAVAADVAHERHGATTLEARTDGSASFSSRGPSAEGAPRPDLSAPGGLFAAALSSDLVLGDPRNVIGGSRAALDARLVGGERIVVEGTSAAAAVVAGAHALAYSVLPARPDRDRPLLLATAEGDEAWTATRGAGALDLRRWLDARRRELGSGAPALAWSGIATTRAVTTPGAADVTVVARLLDDRALPLDGGELVLRAGGRELARATIAFGRAEAQVALDAPAGEEVVVSAEVGEIALPPRTVAVRIDEGERGASARIAGGGCAVAIGAPSATEGPGATGEPDAADGPGPARAPGTLRHAAWELALALALVALAGRSATRRRSPPRRRRDGGRPG